MKTLIYSDVHGNLPAFEKMLKTVGDCERYVCLGDLVNYGPWSNECVELAVSLPNSIILAGNHESAFLSGLYPGNNELVNEFFCKCISDFTKSEIIKTFWDEYRLDQFKCQHTLRDQYIYPDTSIDISENYIIGHSHHQFIYHYKGWTLYNAGSVGQNRKYINVLSYLIYDQDNKTISLENTSYSLQDLISEMRARDYSTRCINYYLQKNQITL